MSTSLCLILWACSDFSSLPLVRKHVAAVSALLHDCTSTVITDQSSDAYVNCSYCTRCNLVQSGRVHGSRIPSLPCLTHQTAPNFAVAKSRTRQKRAPPKKHKDPAQPAGAKRQKQASAKVIAKCTT